LAPENVDRGLLDEISPGIGLADLKGPYQPDDGGRAEHQYFTYID
jgi:hypothetical protein